jgi:glycosyltransferase involved in cell wall biosynthesis
MFMKPKISIVVPVYNVEEVVSECLDSVIEQDFDGAVECIIVDDCGNDRSMEVVKKILSGYNGTIDFKIVTHQENGGLSVARNSGIAAAVGDYIFFLDSDDVIPPNALSLLYQRASEHPDVDIVIGQTKCFPDDNYDAFYDFKRFNVPDYTADVDLIRSWYLEIPHIAWNKLIRREFILADDLYFLPGIIHEDYHWQFKSYFTVSSIAFVSEDTYFYRKRQHSIMANDNEERRLINTLSIGEDILNVCHDWDYQMSRFWCYFLINAKMQSLTYADKKARRQYRRVVSALLRSDKFSCRQKLFLSYFRLPRPYFRGSIMIYLLTHFLGLQRPDGSKFTTRFTRKA